MRLEPGVNLDLHSTLHYVFTHRERVSQWGPYECRPRLYEQLLVQKAFLESGRYGYQCTDTHGEAARTGNGCDCIHAITDADPQTDRSDYPLNRFGDEGSEHVVEHMMTSGALLGQLNHDWLNERLGLAGYPIVRRTYLDSWPARRGHRQTLRQGGS